MHYQERKMPADEIPKNTDFLATRLEDRQFQTIRKRQRQGPERSVQISEVVKKLFVPRCG